MLFATGLMLKFVYQPDPDRAYESIIHLQNNAIFGQLIPIFIKGFRCGSVLAQSSGTGTGQFRLLLFTC
jgi:hypothetical protein